jgi:hypothetical protein
MVAAGQTVEFDSSSQTTGTFNFNGSGETTGATAAFRIIRGGTGDGTVVGGSGNDTILGGSGNDTITGGAGADSIDLSSGGADRVVISVPATSDTVSTFDFGTNTTVNDVVAISRGGFTGVNELKRVESGAAVAAIVDTPAANATVTLTAINLTDAAASTAVAATDIVLFGGAAGAYNAATDTAAEIQALLRGGAETVTLTNAANFVGSFLAVYLAGNGTTATDLRLALVTSDGTGATTAAADANVTVTDIGVFSGITTVGNLNGVSNGASTASDFIFIA